MTTVRRKAKRRYIGAPWPRGTGSQKVTKMERTKSSKPRSKNIEAEGRHFILPLVIKPGGRWAYKHGKLARQLKKARR